MGCTEREVECLRRELKSTLLLLERLIEEIDTHPRGASFRAIPGMNESLMDIQKGIAMAQGGLDTRDEPAEHFAYAAHAALHVLQAVEHNWHAFKEGRDVGERSTPNRLPFALHASLRSR